MEGMGLEFTPVVGRHLLGHLSMFGPMAGTTGTHIVNAYSPNEEFNLPPASHPSPPPAHCLYIPSVILQWF